MINTKNKNLLSKIGLLYFSIFLFTEVYLIFIMNFQSMIFLLTSTLYFLISWILFSSHKIKFKYENIFLIIFSIIVCFLPLLKYIILKISFNTYKEGYMSLNIYFNIYLSFILIYIWMLRYWVIIKNKSNLHSWIKYSYFLQFCLLIFVNIFFNSYYLRKSHFYILLIDKYTVPIKINLEIIISLIIILICQIISIIQVYYESNLHFKET
jgi:hypothetical protein